jgi:hypothetical protein
MRDVVHEGDQVKEDEIGRVCSINGGEEECTEDLVGKSQGKRSLGRPRRRRVDNVKIDLREIGWGSTDWIDLVQDRNQWRVFVNTVMNLMIP